MIDAEIIQQASRIIREQLAKIAEIDDPLHREMLAKAVMVDARRLLPQQPLYHVREGALSHIRQIRRSCREPEAERNIALLDILRLAESELSALNFRDSDATPTGPQVGT